MNQFKPLKLSDKAVFDKYFNLTDYNNSEKNFSNLFMWRHYYNYEYSFIDDFLCIRGNYPERFYHYPYGVGDASKVIQLLKKEEGNDLVFKPILNEVKESLDNKDFSLKEDRDSFDYIYSSDKLINLNGSKLRNKRRWIKKFKKNYDYTYEDIKKDNIDEVKDFTLKLIKNPDELIAMEEMFKNFFQLGMKGCIIRVNRDIAGVSTGEELTKDTVLIHCERGNRQYEGIYNVINQEFVKNQWSDYKYINREQDLGIEGLRQAKLTYRPDILLEKYIAKGE